MSKFKIGTKICLGFSLVILNLAALVALVAYTLDNADRSVNMLKNIQMPIAILANQYDTDSLVILDKSSDYLMDNRNTKSRDEALAAFAPMHTSMLASGAKLLAISEASTKAAMSKMMDGLGDKLKHWEALLKDVIKASEERQLSVKQLNEGSALLLATAWEYAHIVDNRFKALLAGSDNAEQNRALQQTLIMRDVLFNFSDVESNIFRAQYADDAVLLRKTMLGFDKLDEQIKALMPLTQLQENQDRLKLLLTQTQHFRKLLATSAEAIEKTNTLSTQYASVSGQLRGLFADTTAVAFKAMEAGANTTMSGIGVTQLLLLIAFAIGLVLSVVIAVIITRMVVRPVKATSDSLSAIAEGDFTVQIPHNMLSRGDEMGIMLNDVQKTCNNLSATIATVMDNANTVATAARQISRGNQQLSEQTQQQAGAIEETASALEQMTSSVKNNAESSSQANDLARTTSKIAQEGGNVLGRTVLAMKDVTESSKKISDIINVVNEIAFQTNLLALNAAVEAARAGEAGRGFAVVAGEVRNLAGRSAQAAKEIQSLITDSVSKVEHGNVLVAESGEILNKIISNVQNVADTIGEITSATQEQATGIAEVSKAVNQMDEAVQQNAAFVEQAASASETMSNVASELQQQMAHFKLRDKNQAPTTRSLPAPPTHAPAKPAVESKPVSEADAPKPTAKPAPVAAKPAPVAAKPAPVAAKPAPVAPATKTENKASGNMEDDFFGVSDMDGFEEF